MTLNLIYHVRTHIAEARDADGFVDANAVAAILHKTYPSVQPQTLIDAVIEETINTLGSVAWEKSGMHDQVLVHPHSIPEPALAAHVLAFQAQGPNSAWEIAEGQVRLRGAY